MGNGGAFTFLFTDIEGSSRLWERAPRAMESAVMRHEQLLADAVAANGGRVVKTLGDGIYAVFDAPAQGIAAAADAMRAIAAEPWPDDAPIRVRMGLHCGLAEERHGDFYGTAVNRTARIANAAHAGQILVSKALHVAVVSGAHPGTTTKAAGTIALRGIAEPETVAQVVAPGLRTDFPPLAGTEVPNNLPRYSTSFFGGDKDRHRLVEMLGEHRLMTVTAIGGGGKTRLAVEAALRAMPHFPDGVWFVDLSHMTASSKLSSLVAATLGVTEFGASDLIDVVVEHLADKRALLILDNCEHVVEVAAAFVEHLLRGAPDTHVLATSRRPLIVAGETLYFLSPLAASDGAGQPGPAVRLFIDRARAVRRDFTPSTDDIAVIAEVCAHLDGIPLAIELAAARMRALDPATLLDRIGDRFGLLVGGPRTADDRQRTLRGAIDWSYELLGEDEQIAFQELSVVPGSFTLAAAEAILGEGSDDPLDVLARLVDNSLLRSTDSVQELRFAMLESLRQYGLDRLHEGGRSNEVTAAFANHYADCATGADERLKGPDQIEWQLRFAADEPNFREAIDVLADSDPEKAIAMAADLGRFWYRKGAVRAGHDVMSLTIDASPEPSEARALALGWLGFFTDVRGERTKARRITTEALEMGRQVDSPRAMAFALNGIGGYESDLGRRRSAADHWRESLAMLDRAGSPWVTAPLFNLGKSLMQLGDYPEAIEAAERLEGFAAEHDDPWTAELSRLLRGYVAHGRGEYQTAQRFLEDTINGFESLGAVFHAVEARIVLSQIAEETGHADLAWREFGVAEAAMADTAAFDHDEAHVLRARMALRGGSPADALGHLERAVRIIEDAPNPHSTALVFHELARIADASGNDEQARWLLDGADRMRLFDRETPTHALRTEAATLRHSDVVPHLHDEPDHGLPDDVATALPLVRSALEDLRAATTSLT